MLVQASAIGFSPDVKPFEIDSKAMRKVDEGQDIAVLIQNNSALHGMAYLLEFRMLVKLH